MCVKHEYLPSDDKKFLGSIQTKYEKKNWSSVMLFNNSECQALTPEVVASQTGLYLHQFKLSKKSPIPSRTVVVPPHKWEGRRGHHL